MKTTNMLVEYMISFIGYIMIKQWLTMANNDHKNGDSWWLMMIWLVVSTYPSEKKSVKFSWDDEIPNWMEQWNSCSEPPTSVVDDIGGFSTSIIHCNRMFH